jgi:hypothetical protein
MTRTKEARHARPYLSDADFAKRLAAHNQGRDREAKRAGGFRNDTGTRTFRQTSLVIDPPDGKIPPFTPYAESRRTTRDHGSFGEGPFDSPLDFTLYDRCITRGVLGSLLPVIYGNGNRWEQSPGYVTITYEMIHDTRVIPLDSRPEAHRARHARRRADARVHRHHRRPENVREAVYDPDGSDDACRISDSAAV